MGDILSLGRVEEKLIISGRDESLYVRMLSRQIVINKIHFLLRPFDILSELRFMSIIFDELVFSFLLAFSIRCFYRTRSLAVTSFVRRVS